MRSSLCNSRLKTSVPLGRGAPRVGNNERRRAHGEGFEKFFDLSCYRPTAKTSRFLELDHALIMLSNGDHTDCGGGDSSSPTAAGQSDGRSEGSSGSRLLPPLVQRLTHRRLQRSCSVLLTEQIGRTGGARNSVLYELGAQQISLLRTSGQRFSCGGFKTA